MAFRSLYQKSLYDAEKIAIQQLLAVPAVNQGFPTFATAKTPTVGDVAKLGVLSYDSAGGAALLLPGDTVSPTAVVVDSTGLQLGDTTTELQLHIKDYGALVTDYDPGTCILTFSEPHGFMIGETAVYSRETPVTVASFTTCDITAVTSNTVTLSGALDITLAMAQAGFYASSVQSRAPWWGFADKSLMFIVQLAPRPWSSLFTATQV